MKLLFFFFTLLVSDFTAELTHATFGGDCNDGSIDLTISGGFASYEIFWYKNGEEVVHTISANGMDGQEDLNNIEGDIEGIVYQVIIIDALCGEIAQSYELKCECNLTGEVFDATCTRAGRINTEFECDAPNNSSPYIYMWSDGETTKNRSNLLPGIYCLTITDNNGNEYDNCYTVGGIPKLDIKLDYFQNVSACDYLGGQGTGDPCDGNIKISIPNYNSNYFVSWSGPNDFESNSKNITNLCTGVYTVTVTDGMGCSISRSYTICCCSSNNNHEEPFPGTVLTCQYDHSQIDLVSFSVTPYIENVSLGAISLNAIGGLDQKYYSWSGPNGYAASSQNISGLLAGTYCVTIFDGCSNEVTECFDITSCDDIPIVFNVFEPCPEFITGAEHMSDGKITLDMAGYTYEDIKWSNGRTGLVNNNILAGLYTVTITINEHCTLIKEIDVKTTEDQNLYDNIVVDGCLLIEECRDRTYGNTYLATTPVYAWSGFACQERQLCEETGQFVFSSPWVSVKDGFTIICSSPYLNDPTNPKEKYKCDYFGDCPLDDVQTSVFLFSGEAKCITCTKIPDALECQFLVECTECIDWAVWPLWCKTRFHCGLVNDIQPCDAYDGCSCKDNEQLIGDCGEENLIQFLEYETDSTSFIAVTQVYNPLSNDIIETNFYLIDNQLNVVDIQKIGSNSLINVKASNNDAIFSFGTLIAKTKIGTLDLDQDGKDAFISSSLDNENMFYYNGIGDQTISDIELLNNEIYAIGSYSKSFRFDKDEPNVLENEGESRLLMFNASNKEIILVGNEGTKGNKVVKSNGDLIIAGSFSDGLELNDNNIASGKGIFIGHVSSDEIGWASYLTSNYPITHSDFTIDNEILYFVVSGNQIQINNQILTTRETSSIVALNINTGGLLWTKDLSDFSSFNELTINDIVVYQNNLIFSGKTDNYGSKNESGGVFIKLDIEGNLSENGIYVDSEIIKNSKFVKNSLGSQLIYSGFTEVGAEDCDDRLFVSTLSFDGEKRNLVERDNSFKYLFPNPAKNILFVSKHKTISYIVIYSSNGPTSLEIKGNKKDIDISNLSSGVYFARIELLNGDTVIEKIIIL